MSKERVSAFLEEEDWADAIAEDPDVTQMALWYEGPFGWVVSEEDGITTDGDGGLSIQFHDDSWPMTEKPDISTYSEDGRTGAWCIITAAV
jgi:hypothetical protein